MQQYQVPQFIDIEDRILGPLTLKQSLYLGAAAATIFIGWKLFHIILFIVVAVPAAALAAAMAFVKIDERPLPVLLKSAVAFYLKPRLYLWRQSRKAAPPPAVTPPPTATGRGASAPLAQSKLDDLAWSLDIKEHTDGQK